MASSGLSGKGAGDPGLLLGHGRSSGISRPTGVHAVQRLELINEHEPCIAEVEPIGKARQIGAGTSDSAEVGTQDKGGPGLGRRGL